MVIQGRQLEKLDLSAAIGEGFYLPAVAKALEEYSLREAEAATFREQIDEFKAKIAAFTQPVFLTEGKTDELILAEAWKRIGGGQPPFKIKCCDITDGRDGGAAGAAQLALALRAVPFDNPQVVIGLFDRDEAGCKEWRLDANFLKDDLFTGVKAAKHGRAFAVLLPSPQFRQRCADHQNLPIEFLFPDEFLDHEVNGQRLELKPIEASRKMGETVVRIPIGSETEFMQIVESSKVNFARVVVPKLPDEAFEGFEALFDLVNKIIEDASR